MLERQVAALDRRVAALEREVAALERRVAALVREHRGELERLVDDALDRALAELVVERIAARNGATPAELVTATPAVLCSSCGERPRIAGRTVCNRCRAARARERRARASASSDDGPRSAGNARAE
jgi:hypothetical protein